MTIKKSKGRIFHLEDDPSWRDIVQELLGDDYEIYSTDARLSAAEMLQELFHKENKRFDLIIIDMRVKGKDKNGNIIEDEKGGKGFIDDLLSSGIYEQRIIILSGSAKEDKEWLEEYRSRVIDIFDKGEFADQSDSFKSAVEKNIATLKRG